MTNQPSGNYLVVMSIHEDGTLSYDKVLATGGRGSRGIGGPIGDSIFSQGSIQVHYGQNLLINTNPGSNTLTMWRVDPKNPLNIRRVGRPVPSGGDFPNSVVFNKAGDRLCVLNTGTNNGFMCYVVDNRRGLRVIPGTFRPLGLNQTIPATGPMNAASQLRFSPDESQLHVSVKGWDLINTRGFLATYDVNLNCPSSAAISSNGNRILTDMVGLRPFGMQMIRGRNAVITADPIAGFDIFDLDKGTSHSTHVFNNGATCWVQYNARTGHYYLIDAGSSLVTELSIDITKDQLEGVIERQYFKVPGSFLADPEFVNIGPEQYFIILAPGHLNIYVDHIFGPRNASQIQAFDLSIVAERANIRIDQNHTNGFITYLNDVYAPCQLE
ncbi:hypothetical protein AX17_002285 [Amanita inopinata Kibby_2008]|nr:hypothetical protein AX17_002285 [Amanita inopinata Kibby_2008]